MTEILEELRNGVLTITLNRPPANTITPAMCRTLQEILLRSEDIPEVRCIVLTGAGKVFCAGADAGNIGEGPPDAEAETNLSDQDSAAAKARYYREAMDAYGALHGIRKPTLAVIGGGAAGAGLVLALACDLRFCLDTAKLTTGFSKMGLSSDSGGSYVLMQLVGPAKAKELMFTAEIITGREAYDMGLVTKISGKNSFEQEARTYAEYIASRPSVALGLIKQNVNASFNGKLLEVFDLEAENIVRTMNTEDHKIAVDAFSKRESAIFEGR